MSQRYRLGISRIALIVIIVVILAVAGGATYFVSLGTSSTTTTSSVASSSSTTPTSSSINPTLTSSSGVLTSHTSSPSSSASLSSVYSSSSSSSSCPSTATNTSAINTSPVKISYVYPAPAIQLSPVAIADKLGIFAQYGLSVTYTQVQSGSIASTLQSGSVQLAIFGPGQAFDAVASGVDLALLAMGDPAGSPFYMMVSPTITTAQDLIGQTIGVSGSPGSATQGAAIFILKSLGLNDSQIKFTYFKNSNVILSALLSGSIGAGILSPPRNIVAAASGFKQMGPVSTDAGFLQPDFVVATSSYLAANPDVVRSFLEAYLVAYRDLWVTMNYLSGVTTPTLGINTTATLEAIMAFTGFNSTLAVQSLKIYQSDKLLEPTMLPVNASIAAAYSFQSQRNPALLTTNMTNAYQWGILNELNTKCGFVYNIWGGSPPPTSS